MTVPDVMPAAMVPDGLRAAATENIQRALVILDLAAKAVACQLEIENAFIALANDVHETYGPVDPEAHNAWDTQAQWNSALMEESGGWLARLLIISATSRLEGIDLDDSDREDVDRLIAKARALPRGAEGHDMSDPTAVRTAKDKAVQQIRSDVAELRQQVVRLAAHLDGLEADYIRLVAAQARREAGR